MNRQEVPMYKTWVETMVGDSLSALSYITQHFDLQSVLILSNLFSPQFIEYKGFIFLKYQFSESGLEQWLDELNNLSEVQKVMNHIHLTQLFYKDDPNDDTNYEMFKILCDIVKYCWTGTLNAKYPDLNFNVSYNYNEDDFDPSITFWQD
jgi:hypothetical protein